MQESATPAETPSPPPGIQFWVRETLNHIPVGVDKELKSTCKHIMSADLSVACPMQGQATCSFGNRTVLVEGSTVAAAVTAYSAGHCSQISLTGAAMSVCGCELYETALLAAVQVETAQFSLCQFRCCMVSFVKQSRGRGIGYITLHS